MPPKTRASQRNKAQAPAASMQLVTITVDASELQVMIEMNKPTTKCTHANDTTGTDTDAVPVKKKAKAAPPQHDTAPKAKVNPAPKPHKTKATPPPYDMAGPEVKVNLIPKGSKTLQGWKGHNNHPGLVDQKRAKCTSAQVQADKEAKVEAKRQLEELEEEKRKLYMQMEINYDEQELEHQVNVIHRLSDVIVTDRGGTESKGEYFDMDVEGSDSEDVDIEPKAVGKKNLVSCTLIDMLKLSKHLVSEKNQGFASNDCSCKGNASLWEGCWQEVRACDHGLPSSDA